MDNLTGFSGINRNNTSNTSHSANSNKNLKIKTDKSRPQQNSGNTKDIVDFDKENIEDLRKPISPLGTFRVSSEFGPRNGKQHKGIDLAAPQGTPIKAVMNGKVSRIAKDPKGYGQWVELSHPDGTKTRYAHMSKFGDIKMNQNVEAGAVLGSVGNTGRSSGPHLHFEWRDKNNQPVNPREKIDFRSLPNFDFK